MARENDIFDADLSNELLAYGDAAAPARSYMSGGNKSLTFKPTMYEAYDAESLVTLLERMNSAMMR